MKRRVLLGVLAVMIIALQARLWIGDGSLAHVSALRSQVESKQTTNEVKTERNRVLKAEIGDLKNGVDSIEQKARSELGMIRQGETFFMIVPREEER
ncbi:MAG: septum formation initiator family protein [Pseudomonadales bacterium]|nr:septum formation initiator family protein [Pseudomonadales bacterium]